MSTPPFIAIPDGVGVFEPPAAPAPVLVAEPVAAGADVTDTTAGAGVTSGTDGEGTDPRQTLAAGAAGPWLGSAGAAGPSLGSAGAAGPSLGSPGAAGPSHGSAGAAGPSHGSAGAADPSLGSPGGADPAHGSPGGADPSLGSPGAAGPAHGSPGAADRRDPADREAGTPQPTDAGKPTARGDVLLVPGFTGSKEDFIAILLPLARRGWRVAAMDLPGQGGFAGLGPRGSHTAAALASTVRSVAEWFAPGRRVHLVGHSMGGLVTREVVLDSPESLVSWTAMCSGPGAIPAEGHASLLQLQAALGALPMDQIWVRKEAADRAGGWNPPSQAVADFCARRFISNDPVALADCCDLLMHAPDTTDDVAQCLDEFGLFASVVTGALDDAWPIAQQGQMAERLGVPWRVLPGIGHNPATEDPETTAEVLDSVFAAATD